MGGRDAKVIYICIFRIVPLDIRTSGNDFFVAECLFVRPKASDCAHVAWSRHIHSQQRNNATRSDSPTVQLLQ